MKKNTKKMAKVVVAIMAAVLMFFVPIGQIVSVADINEESVVEIVDEALYAIPIETTVANINSVVTTVPVTTVITTTTTITTTTSKITTEKKKIFIFKPETHYVHTKDCYWTECGIIEEITNTEGLEARLCDECCPDIEIINLYEEPEIDYTETYTDYNENEYSSEECYSEESESNYAAQGSYNISDWEYTLLCRIVSSEYGSDWVPVEEKAKIVASVMAMVYNPNYPDTIEGVLDVACVPWGFNKYYDYYMSDSIYAAVDYYFTSGAYDGWTCTSWCGDGTWNYFS
ncbi:MAG: hypothetical protein ACI311_04740 [Bacilli bacterium]